MKRIEKIHAEVDRIVDGLWNGRMSANWSHRLKFKMTELLICLLAAGIVIRLMIV